MKQLLAKFFMPRTLYDNGMNSPWDEQSVGQTVQDEQSGTNRPGDEQSPNLKK